MHQHRSKTNLKMIALTLFVILAVSYASANPLFGRFFNENWRIVGGSSASDGEFPHQVSLLYRGLIHRCGGSIMNSNWVLTAAHCIAGATADQFSILAGSNFINEGGEKYQVQNFILHENYNWYTLENDIGLVRVVFPIKFGPKVQPIVLEDKHISEGSRCTLCGWGRTSISSSTTNELQRIDLQVISNEQCSSLHEINVDIIFETSICTLTKVGEGACSADSGGALIANGKQIGVVSWGRNCATGYPDVFARVSEYIDWIEANME